MEATLAAAPMRRLEPLARKEARGTEKRENEEAKVREPEIVVGIDGSAGPAPRRRCTGVVAAGAPETYSQMIVRYDPFRNSAVSFTISDWAYWDTIELLAVGGGRLVAIGGGDTGGRLVAYDLNG
jgi:hypothetical protein